MSQIPLHHNATTGTNSALSGLGGPSANTRKDSGRAQATTSASSPSFSQLLNQSSQHLQTKAPQPQVLTQAAAQPAAKPATPAKAPSPANKATNGANGAGTSAQEENKLAARNAANRNAANKQAEHQADAPKAPAKPAQPHAEGADKTQVQNTKAQGKSADGADKAGKTDKSDAADKTTAQDDSSDAAKTDATDPAAAAQQMMAMLRGDAPQDPKLSLKDSATLADGATDGQSAVGGHGKGGHHGVSAQDHDQLQQELQQATRAALDGKTEAGEGAEGMQALAGGSQEIALGGSQHAGGAHQSFEAMLAAAQQADATNGTTGPDQTGSADAPSVPLSQPLDSPDFAPELSASVSLLIQDGVHEAQLQLNPTDMGPVSIQIQVDGQQAQVNFHAEQAATRDVLMRSMPDLAAALQSQGLTLSGGGVFAQAQSGNGQNGRGSDSEGGSRRGGRGGQDDDGVTSVSRAERRAQPRGLVDLYA